MWPYVVHYGQASKKCRSLWPGIEEYGQSPNDMSFGNVTVSVPMPVLRPRLYYGHQWPVPRVAVIEAFYCIPYHTKADGEQHLVLPMDWVRKYFGLYMTIWVIWGEIELLLC